MSLTDKAIGQIRDLIRTGALPPGSKLPPGPELAWEHLRTAEAATPSIDGAGLLTQPDPA
ncbi:hypothetical protein STSP_27140 [Streptomyces jeddahensis]|uniref:Uncharacterized protein n=1 Tax=Streptomyces jeddahensis TaxID=1716141 RepID=A0A177HTD9_9ACTN|nr:hypothetical protein STSP_27140 [Streptomyces jeddahensis]